MAQWCSECLCLTCTCCVPFHFSILCILLCSYCFGVNLSDGEQHCVYSDLHPPPPVLGWYLPTSTVTAPAETGRHPNASLDVTPARTEVNTVVWASQASRGQTKDIVSKQRRPFTRSWHWDISFLPLILLTYTSTLLQTGLGKPRQPQGASPCRCTQETGGHIWSAGDTLKDASSPLVAHAQLIRIWHRGCLSFSISRTPWRTRVRIQIKEVARLLASQ